MSTETISVFAVNHTKSTNIPCKQNAVFLKQVHKMTTVLEEVKAFPSPEVISQCCIQLYCSPVKCLCLSAVWQCCLPVYLVRLHHVSHSVLNYRGVRYPQLTAVQHRHCQPAASTHSPTPGTDTNIQRCLHNKPNSLLNHNITHSFQVQSAFSTCPTHHHLEVPIIKLICTRACVRCSNMSQVQRLQ